jgi:hypothetical protein
MRNQRKKSNRAASLALVAVCLIPLIGVGAIAIDLGMLLKARADAQRAAEAGALAGASVFLNVGLTGFEYQSIGETRGRDFAEANAILNSPVVLSEIESLTVDVPNQRVRVRVARNGVSTWFARILDTASVRVSGAATAAVVESGGATCVRPLMIPDLWSDPSQDPNNTGIEDNGEDWTYDPNQDTYAPFDPGSGAPQTGYGSNARDPMPDMGNNTYAGDYGRQLSLVPAVSGVPTGPNDFQLWDYQNPGSDPPTLEQRISECDPRTVRVGENDYEKMGTDPAEVMDELQGLMNQGDPTGAHWDQTSRTMQASSGDWRDSPRVIKVALYDPHQIANMAGSGSPVTFNNLGLFLLEGVTSTGLTGRFLYYVNGTNDEAVTGGSLVKHVRLVQ